MKHCPELFHNIYVEKVEHNQVQIANCCLQPRSDPVNKIDFDHPYLAQERQFNLVTGQLPASCIICTELEDQGVQSRRIQLLDSNEYDFLSRSKIVPSLKKLNYNCENICNLKCITCSSFNSSAWLPDEIKLCFPIQYKGKNTKVNKLAMKLNLDGVEIISFNGGEPLMTDDHLHVLQHLVDNYDASKIYVQYNTNATFRISDQIRQLWEKFRTVTLSCSIDGIQESFNYTRFPAKWVEVENIIKEYQQLDAFVSIGMTVGLHNVLYVKDTLNWANLNNIPMGINHCQGHLALDNWPAHLKNELLNYLDTMPEILFKQDLINLAKSVTGKDLYWVDYFRKLDSIRGNSWKQDLHRLYDLDPDYFDAN